MEGLVVAIFFIYGVFGCLVVALFGAWFLQLACRMVLKYTPMYWGMYTVSFKVLMISYVINFFIGQLALLLGSLAIYVNIVFSLAAWLGLVSYLYARWLKSRRRHEIGFKRGLLVNLVSSGCYIAFGLIIIFIIAAFTVLADMGAGPMP